MRRHASPSSAGSSPGRSGRLRLALLAATAAAFLLVPTSQAFAFGNLNVTIEGTGSGSVEGSPISTFPMSFTCSYVSPGPATGTCTTPLVENEEETLEGFSLEDLDVTVAPGSENTSVEVEGASFSIGCVPGGTCTAFNPIESETDINLTVVFDAEPTPEPKILTASKTGSGNGWLHSEAPAYAINCGTACTTKSAELEGEVTLTASGAQFAGWESCPGVESGRSCTVEMDADKEAVAEYAANHAITVTKTGSGDGWVHSEGPPYAINCGAGCTTKTGFFESSTVVLTASGSQFSEWTSCPSGVISGRTCTINSSSAQSAEVKYGS